LCSKFNDFFLSFRDRLIDNYPELFTKQGGAEFSAISQFSTKWGWYESIYTLAKGDITRIEHITELNVHKCFMMLAFIKEKNELEMKQIKKNR